MKFAEQFFDKSQRAKMWKEEVMKHFESKENFGVFLFM